MELKRILARDSRSANEKAIQLYGPEVLIISSQRVDQQTELIVAVEVAAAPTSADTTSAADHFFQAELGPKSMPSATQAQPATPFLDVFQQANAQAVPKRPMLEDPATPVASIPTAVEAQLQGVWATEATKSAVADALPSPLAQPSAALAQPPELAMYEAQRSHEIVAMMRDEMAALRKEFALARQMQTWQNNSGLSQDIQKLSMAMQEVGMPVGLRSLLTDSIQELQTLDEAWPVVTRLLVDAIDCNASPTPVSGVHALCGPSGAGKTSMLARLAYAAAQTHGADKQVMVSFGDQRPGAWAQIQLLASQAGATAYRAADVAMLKSLLEDLQGKTIWIDTPGTDFTNQAQQLIQMQAGIGLHAVLPVDATVTSVQKILQNSDIRWNSLMLTKLDEAAYPWPLIKGLCDQSLSVSCMSQVSQIHVPAVPFDARRLVDLGLVPLQSLLPEIKALGHKLSTVKVARKTRSQKPATESLDIQTPAPAVKLRVVTAKAASKVAHG